MYILYNYKLYKLTMKIYVHKYVSTFFWQKNVFHCWFKRIVSYFYNRNKNLYNKFEFLEN